MKLSDKEQELFQFLSECLPYGIKIEVEVWSEETQSSEMQALPIYDINTDGYVKVLTDDESIQIRIDQVQPYLRSLSSMTREELDELNVEVFGSDEGDGRYCYRDYVYAGDGTYEVNYKTVTKIFKALRKRHFDYAGLIASGQAIEVTKENNPY